MSRSFTIALLLCCLTSTAAGQRAVERRLPLKSDGAVRITNLVGSIRVRGWARDSIVATGEMPRSRLGFYMGGDRNAVKLGIETPGDDVSAAEPAKLEVWVPSGSRVRVKSALATVDIANVTGTVDVTSTGGAITVAGAPREMTVESIDGDLTLDGAVSWLRARSAGGDIVIHGGAEDLVASSVSGSVSVSGGPLRAARVETMTGVINFEAALVRGAIVDVGTHGGPVRMVLAKGTQPSVEVTTVAAPIENNLTPQRPLVRGESGRELALSLGDYARITIRSFKGPVTLSWGARVKASREGQRQRGRIPEYRVQNAELAGGSLAGYAEF